ncbi:MAG: TolC family protein [Muribaculaceae bacterium]|nr:TolC family protein [Muribaculaceae bacterium]
MRFSLIILSFLCCFAGSAQEISLDSCRNMAIHNNKTMRIANEKIIKASYQNQEARAAYLPGIDFVGSYMYNQKELSIFDSDQLLPTKSFNLQTGKYEYNLVVDPSTGKPIQTPDGGYVPSTVALIPKEAMTYDIHNVFAGAITLTQPVFMGGKIIAMNKITKYAEQLATDLRDNEALNIIYNVDAAYWQVVSLSEKKKLAQAYVNLLDSLNHNVNAMKEQGIATKSDLLSVSVKLNEANVTLTKVDNGLVLSRMLLNQLCGLPVNEVFVLADENKSQEVSTMVATEYNMNDVYSQRKDVKALQTAVQIFEQKQKVAMSSMLPNVALVGTYSFSNPNLFNGFKKEFAGAFSVGAMVTIPIWHWGGNYNKYRAAKSDTNIKRLELADAMEKIELQVSQASFKTQEAVKTYNLTKSNMEKADENLRQAQLGFKEGMLTTDNVMEAQTAWLKASSEVIDAGIDVQLCKVYLSKVLGTLNY